MIKVAILGFGGIAQAAHMPAYRQLEAEGKIKLVAVCDIDPSRFGGNMEINIGGSEEQLLGEDVKRYTAWQDMVANEQFDMVDICVPTFLHAELAIEMLSRGYHVLSEKPMSLRYADCLRMCEAAKTADRRLMIGQCLRFGNEYGFLRDAIQNNTFGKPLTGTFRRLSAPPIWGWDNWFMDPERSGGCLLDLHIHDVDIIRCLFGEPEAFTCNTQDVYSKKDLAHSRLYYPDFSILAIGDWSQQGVPFTADYRVGFEKAIVDYAGGVLTVYPRDGEPYTPEWSANNFYTAEIEYFVNLLETGAENTLNPPESAALTVKLINALEKSAACGGEKMKNE